MSHFGRLLLCSYGTGDPDLLPVRTVDALRQATLALYPDSMPSEIVDLIPPATRHENFPLTSAFVPGERVWADVRAEISRGGTVVRLYPDSPQIDPVALREARMLSRDGVQFEVVGQPLVALQAACYAGVPLDVDRGPVTLMGQQRTAVVDPSSPATTIVSAGRMERPHEVAKHLISLGLPAVTPCLVIQRPAHPTQQLQESQLGALSTWTNGATGGVLIAGELVRHRAAFDWFERLPLYGKRVLVTRARAQAREMGALLRQLGAQPVQLPAIEIVPAADPRPLGDAIARLDGYDWVVFTSANGVRAFFERLDESDKDVRALGNTRVAAIGSATAAELRSRAVKADYVPERYVAEEVLAGMLERGAGNARVLLPRAEQAREVLPEGLRSAGAAVDVVAAYRTVSPEPSADVLRSIREGQIDVVTLTSSSTARNLAEMLDGRLDTLRTARVACIGPITAQTARDVGFHVDIIAEEFTVPGLIAAVVAACERSAS